MERLRLTNTEKQALIEEFTAKVNAANKLTDITFTSKGIINELNAKDVIKPTVIIDVETMYKMQSLVDASSVEISWHGFVKRNVEKQIYYIYDIALFPQINTASATTTDQDKYAEWISEYIMDPESDFENMRMHGHSHVNMNVFSSGVDDAYQKDLIRNTEDGDYYIFIIMNKKREICILLYDFHQQILFKTADITLGVATKDNIVLETWAKDQIKEFCSEPKSRYTYNSYSIQSKDWDRNKSSTHGATGTKETLNKGKRKGILRR